MNMRTVLFVTLVALVGMQPLQSQAQVWSGIIAPDRAIDWSAAGVAGGIPNRNTICASLNPGANLAQINSAISTCPSGQVVFLNPGTYNLGAGMIEVKQNVTLRGAGANQTKLYFTGRGNCGGIASVICIRGLLINGGYGSAPQNLTNWTAGYAKGTTILTFASTAGLAVGNSVILEQLDDTADSDGVYVCKTAGVCSYSGGGGEIRPDRSQRQLVKVTAISGNQVTIAQPLHMPNWRTSQTPTARWVNSSHFGVGVEDLSIDLMAASNTGGTQSNIAVLASSDSWVKGVRSVMADRSHIQIYQSTRITVRDNYLYGSWNGQSTSYGVETFGNSGDLLIENNIVQHNTAPFVINDGGSGSVYGYNFTIDNFRSAPTELMSSSFHIHSPAAAQMLFEGNDGLAFVQDNWYGTSHFMTLFRNHFYADIYNNPVKTTQTAIMQIAAYSRFFNFVGNVLGKPGLHTVYEPSGNIGCGPNYIFCFGYSHASGGVTDTQTKPRAMRWGNYDTVTGTVRFQPSEVPSGLTRYANPIPTTQTLPASFYLSGKPAWFGNVAWPPIGPDVTGGNINGYAGHANKIPARLCWENSAVDSEYPGRDIRIFERGNCYSGTPDTVAPTVSLNGPAPGASVSGIIAVSAAASDNVAVSGVQFKLDGANLDSEDTSAPYAIAWDTAQIANGSHTLTAVARDPSGNTTTSTPLSVTVSNPLTAPSITTQPASQTRSVGQTATFSVTATGTVPLSYQWTRNGADISAATGSSHTTPALTLADNGASYAVRVSNSVGSTTSNSAILTVQNTTTMGATNVLAGDDSGNGNILIAQQATLSATATLQSLSFYVNQAAGNLRLGVYDGTGPGGGPGALRAQTASFTPTIGWNTAPVATPVLLPAGTYWLAYLPSDNNLHFATNFSSGTFKSYPYPFGAMPATFSTSPNSGTTHWSLYATLSLGTITPPPDTTAPTAPGTPTVTAVSSTQLNLSWAASTDNVAVTGYRLERCAGSTCTAFAQVSAPTASTYNDNGLAGATEYRYRVRATDAAGNFSAYSGIANGTTQPVPAPLPGTCP